MSNKIVLKVSDRKFTKDEPTYDQPNMQEKDQKNFQGKLVAFKEKTMRTWNEFKDFIKKKK